MKKVFGNITNMTYSNGVRAQELGEKKWTETIKSPWIENSLEKGDLNASPLSSRLNFPTRGGFGVSFYDIVIYEQIADKVFGILTSNLVDTSIFISENGKLNFLQILRYFKKEYSDRIQGILEGEILIPKVLSDVLEKVDKILRCYDFINTNRVEENGLNIRSVGIMDPNLELIAANDN